MKALKRAAINSQSEKALLLEVEYSYRRGGVWKHGLTFPLWIPKSQYKLDDEYHCVEDWLIEEKETEIAKRIQADLVQIQIADHPGQLGLFEEIV